MKEINEFPSTSHRLEAESSSDGEEKPMSDWTDGTDGTDDLDTEWFSGNLDSLHFFLSFSLASFSSLLAFL